MRGRWRQLSRPRRLIIDLMRCSQRVPSIPIERRLAIAPVLLLRNRVRNDVPWPALFVKAFALVCGEMPELRRCYLSWPIAHLHEPQASVAAIMIERQLDREPIVLPLLIKDPASLTIVEIGRAIRHAGHAPIESVRDFKRALDIAALPAIIRRLIWWVALNIGRQRSNYLGTFAVSVVSGLGSDLTHPISPLPVLLTYGPIDADGGVTLRLVFDHRSLDGAQVARALDRLERVLLGPVVEELETMVAGATASPIAT